MIQIFKDIKNRGKWIIRTGMLKDHCVLDNLSEQNLRTIYRNIGKLLKIHDWKKEMEEDKDRFLEKLGKIPKPLSKLITKIEKDKEDKKNYL